MRLANAMGIPWEEQYEEGTEDHDDYVGLLLDVTCDFIRAGGSITLTEWSGFTELERAVAKDAGDTVRSINASLIGLSAQGHHASVLALVDNGQALVSQKLNELLDKVEGKTPGLAGLSL